MLRLVLLFTCLLLASGSPRDESPGVAGVSHVTITVSNLTSSISFYTELLGGMVAEEISNLLPTQEAEYIRLLTRSKTAIEGTCSSKDGTQNCESLSDSLQVSWAFIVFDNMMVQLVQFTPLSELPDVKHADEDKTEQVAPPYSHMNMMGTKLAFWVMDAVDMSDYANKLEEESHSRGFNKVRFIRPLLLADTADKREANEGVHTLRDEKLRGLSIGYATGPDGESLKFIQLVNTSRKSFERHYCRSKMVTSALVDRSYVDQCGRYKNGDSSQLHGVNHISIASASINRSLDFYESIMGGYLIDDVQPSNLQSPALQKLLMKFKKAPKLMAKPQSSPDKKLNEDKASYKVSSVKDKTSKDKDTPRVVPPHVRHEGTTLALNMRYLLFGNVKLEIVFLTGVPDGMEAMLRSLQSMGSQSMNFMLPGNMEIAFVFHTNTTLESFVNNSSLSQGKPENNIRRIEGGPLKGLEYSLTEGPNKEPISLLHFGGESRKRLHHSLRTYGSVASLFLDANPWTYDGYDKSCTDKLS